MFVWEDWSVSPVVLGGTVWAEGNAPGMSAIKKSIRQITILDFMAVSS
jgi:hypothetical protein